mmetsp:Transcript_42818/g.96707  ORF Transcript_42818/g.96707 Transcript_42818/m.96707 type:complete len:237 (-) Transcript_42818:81-791(-)|eukprot:CAMPEP_0197893502 /NCGR_PEP_ID=MMETSP1439-20131203/32792_1 /TAXON_ID=66791 /ORGANISM="Gonyaulax spinifera, Strain CCMP409" /LENGTH=236 /DNA_ID=CAMNT_0043513771 /DNA_START=103 /DNA_END=813 /DNA_ORIENTATION=-
MSYYSGSRRMALGGKGWTMVLGSLISLSYIRTRARWEHNETSQEYQKLEDEQGQVRRFVDQPEVPGKREDIVLRIWRQCPEIPLPNLYVLGGCLTAIWAYRMWGAFGRLMEVRYADIGYQLRRPDVLANKVVALKYLAVPVFFIPAGALLCWGTAVATTRPGEPGPLQRQAAALRSIFREPCQEVGVTTRGVLDPVAEDLMESPIADFARRSQMVGRAGFGDTTSVGTLSAPAPWR